MTTLKATFEALGYSESTAGYYAGTADPHVALVRGAFLHMLWSLVIDEDHHVDREPAWIESWMRSARKRGEVPTGLAATLQRVLDKGVDPEDLTDIVRAQQWEIIYNVCQLLDGEWLDDLRNKLPDLPGFSWRLYEVAVGDDYVASPVRALEDLHAELGDLDPTGRGGDARAR
ncbi:MAG: hypothetical protein H6708_28810 [Kofleriaceae bacterium]|nr:hypothetical protein [Myxococcales bacterium]MCB9564403.1 hypothetical protein [Kofleriaceae bacterium]